MTEKVRYGTPTGDGNYKYAYDKTPGRRYTRSKLLMEEDAKKRMRKKGMLTGGQAKIAAKAPPPDKIDAKDFAVLRAEKAKGRGMGLQDEKVKPGKVMKARVGKSIKNDPTKPISSVKPKVGRYSSMEEMRKAKGFKPGETPEAFNKRRAAEKLAKTASRAGTIGKIALGVAAAGIGAKKYLESKMKKDKKMGGGMMNKPMGYKSGTMVMARGCKLGRKKATKIT